LATNRYPTPDPGRHPAHTVARRVAMSAATAFLAVNLWTGAPLFALWVGAQVVGREQVTFQAIFVVLAVLGVVVLAMSLVLARLNAAYDRVIGRPSRERRLTWLRPVGDGKGWRDELRGNTGTTILGRIVMVTVWVAVIAFFVWFFAFARSPLPGCSAVCY
jgi:hypothetical protein